MVGYLEGALTRVDPEVVESAGPSGPSRPSRHLNGQSQPSWK